MSHKIRIYIYSSCNTCKKAIKWLEENNLNFESIDITKYPPTKLELKKALIQYKNIKYLFNSSGASYRNIGANNIKALNDEDSIDALSEDGKLIKRPFLITSKDKILIGFKLLEWEKIFSN